MIPEIDQSIAILRTFEKGLKELFEDYKKLRQENIELQNKIKEYESKQSTTNTE